MSTIAGILIYCKQIRESQHSIVPQSFDQAWSCRNDRLIRTLRKAVLLVSSRTLDPLIAFVYMCIYTSSSHAVGGRVAQQQ